MIEHPGDVSESSLHGSNLIPDDVSTCVPPVAVADATTDLVTMLLEPIALACTSYTVVITSTTPNWLSRTSCSSVMNVIG